MFASTFKDLTHDILDILVVLESPVQYLSQFADFFVPVHTRECLWSRIMDFCGSGPPDNMLRAEYDEVARHYGRVVDEVAYLQQLYGVDVVPVLCVPNCGHVFERYVYTHPGW